MDSSWICSTCGSMGPKQSLSSQHSRDWGKTSNIWSANTNGHLQKGGGMMTTLHLPHVGIVLLVGPSNTGKTTLLKQLIQENQILASEVVSSDQFRVLVSDIEFISWNGRPKDESEALFQEYQQISSAAFDAA